MSTQGRPDNDSPLAGPPVNRDFAAALDQLVAIARQGHRADSQLFNPPDRWLTARMPVLQDLPKEQRKALLEEAERTEREARQANAAGKASARTWPEAVVRLDNGGLAFYSQLGVARRPDLTQYFVDGFMANRDALAFSESNQALFTEVFIHLAEGMKDYFASGETVIQSDRQICDASGRSFHARQLFFGDRYLQVPYMWRQLTFELPEAQRSQPSDILEISLPQWLETLGLPEGLKTRISDAGLTQLVFKAPTRGLSLHLGFDYVGEHKMGPLSIAMFLTKESGGVAVQAALSMARVRTLDGNLSNAALVTVGPSLHGKSTLTIMIDLAESQLSDRLGLDRDPAEGVYPMNDDIVLLRPLSEQIESLRVPGVKISHAVDGTENNFYAVPFGVTVEDDPTTYAVLRGTEDSPNPQETLENVPVDVGTGTPDYLRNPVRNMRAVLSRPRLISRKDADHLLADITDGHVDDAVHVPMEYTDRVLWQAVMRQNAVIPPLRRLTLEQYIRVLMYGEAVQMGAAVGAIGRPYVEYFSDPFIIGLEDENANLMHRILLRMADDGLPQEYYVFNTGGVGAETNEEASGPRYKKIPRELTLTLQEAVLRKAVRFEYDPTLRSDVAVAVVDGQGKEVLDLRLEWLPIEVYGKAEYGKRVVELSRRRYYGRDAHDRAGILRYTKVTDALLDMADIPAPSNERELAWLLSFYWYVDEACSSLSELLQRRGQGRRPSSHLLDELGQKYRAGVKGGLELPSQSLVALQELGVGGVN